MRVWIGPVAAALTLAAAGPSLAAPTCAPAGAEAARRGWFAAFAHDDYAGGYALQTPGFFAYDGGKRYDGPALGETVKAAKATGVKIVWDLQEMTVREAWDQAWAAWVNRGSSGKPGAEQPVTWLESAAVEYSGGHWRVAFLHSDRVAPQP